MQYSVHAGVEQIIRDVNLIQEQGRSENNLKLQGVAQINAEALAIQKSLTSTMNMRTQLLSEIEKEHQDFVGQMNANAAYKFNVRKQINDIQYLIRLLNFEISQQEATKKKVTATVNAEKAIQIEKDKRESEMV